MTRSALFLSGIAILMSPAAAAPQGASNVDRYIELRNLFGSGFSCTRAVRPGGPMRPDIWRLYDDWDEQLDRVRAALVRIEGEERVSAVERSLESEDSPPHFTGPCSVAASDRARAQFRRRLLTLQPRLGLPRESRPGRGD